MGSAADKSDKYVVRQLEDIDEARSTCGFRKALFTSEDSDALSVSVLRIDDSSKHYHNDTYETYFVLEGEGQLELNDDIVPLKPGTAVLIKPGVRHTARGKVTALIVGTPPFRADDMFMDEQA